MPHARGFLSGPDIVTPDLLDGLALYSELTEQLASQFKLCVEAEPAYLTYISSSEMKTFQPHVEKLLALYCMYAKELPVAAAVYSAHRKR